MSAKSKKIWSQVREQIAAGNFPKVFVTKADKLALDGSAAEIPALAEVVNNASRCHQRWSS